MLPEILFDVPGTAHCLGGCVIGDSPEHGVVDHRNRVFGYKNMYICDGSVVGSNLGVNPSLTIAALTERAMSFVRPADSTDWDDSAEDATRSKSLAGSAEL
jgi:cholesterol oxidase